MHLQQVEVFQLDLQTWTGRGGRGVSLVLGVMFLWVLMKAQLPLRVCVVRDISVRLAHVCVCLNPCPAWMGRTQQQRDE